MKWFKFYGQDYLSDPKILALSASERSCWITLLAYGSVNDNGIVHFLAEEQLMVQSGISPMHEEWEITRNILKKLENLKMITYDNNTITILNWGKRQENGLTGYQRVKRYREKHKYDNNDNVVDNTKITLEENRIDKKRKDKIIILNTGEQSSQEKVKKFNPLGAEIIKALEVVDPKNKTYYSNKTQRSACDFLLSEYGLEEVLKRISVLNKTNKLPYFPKINSPNDLKEKWVKLQDQVNAKRVELQAKKRDVVS